MRFTKYIIIFFVVILAITFIRSAIGILMKALMSGLQPDSASNDPNPKRNSVPISGELRRDPVCGTYVAAASSIHEKVRGQEVYFCSTACRDRFHAA